MISLQDVSRKVKAGLKGPNAAAWLASQAIAVPIAPNRWAALPGGGLIGRLAEAEFFIEDGPAERLPALLDDSPRGVYPVPRADACFTLEGRAIHEVLVQVCNVNFQGHAPDALFMTSMAGVSVLAIPQHGETAPMIRIWADPTFGPYLWKTLSNIIDEVKKGPQ
jgi:sarcosine oxidase subunit gamma